MEDIRPKYEEHPVSTDEPRQEWELSSEEEVPFHIPRD